MMAIFVITFYFLKQKIFGQDVKFLLRKFK